MCKYIYFYSNSSGLTCDHVEVVLNDYSLYYLPPKKITITYTNERCTL